MNNANHLPTLSRGHAGRRHAEGGFTVVELLVVLAVLAILSGLTGSSLNSLVDGMRLRVAANDFLSTLYVARSEAIKRNMRVAVCKSGDGQHCAAQGDWSQGWIMFEDLDNSGSAGPGEQVIHVGPALSHGLRLVGNQPVANYVSFSPLGRTRTVSGAFQAGTIMLCGPPSRPSTGRQIVVNNVGRMRVDKLPAEQCGP